ncbi:chemotaxis protein CheD [Megalodesulfovibrio paquesii]
MPTLNSLLDSSLPVMHLRISECIFTRKRCLVTTVLGSCISVTFHHAESGMSAICHAMLPQSDGGFKGRELGDHGACRFVDVAITVLLNRFRRCGIAPKTLDAKLFGGACTLLGRSPVSAARLESGAYWNLNIGGRNVDVARRMLAEAGIPIRGEHVGGALGRKLFFHTESGDVWLKSLR